MSFENDQDREVIITRQFDAPRELVFAAWTEPQHVMQWWGPKGFVSTACELDLRVGGSFCLQLRGPDGGLYAAEGVFREIDPPARIVYDGRADEGHPCGCGLPPYGRVTITFEERHGKTLLTVHALLRSSADREAAMAMGFETGWESSLERLDEYLAVE